MSAREDVLARIAAAHRAAPPPDLPYAGIARDYRTESDLGPELGYRVQGRTYGPHGPLGPESPTPHPAPEATWETQG